MRWPGASHRRRWARVGRLLALDGHLRDERAEVEGVEHHADLVRLEAHHEPGSDHGSRPLLQRCHPRGVRHLKHLHARFGRYGLPVGLCVILCHFMSSKVKRSPHSSLIEWSFLPSCMRVPIRCSRCCDELTTSIQGLGR
jgi:hypothetical protein